MPIHPTEYTQEDYERDKEDLIKEGRNRSYPHPSDADDDADQTLAREIAFSIANMLQDLNIKKDQNWKALVGDLRDIEEAIMDMEEE